LSTPPSKSAECLIHLFQALVDKLPKPITVWPIDDRAKWLKAAAMAFNLIYKNIEGERLVFSQNSSKLRQI